MVGQVASSENRPSPNQARWNIFKSSWEHTYLLMWSRNWSIPLIVKEIIQGHRDAKIYGGDNASLQIFSP